MGDPYSLSEILWSRDPASQQAIWLVLGVFLVVAVLVLIPLTVRLVRLYRLERQLRGVLGPDSGEAHAENRDALRETLLESPIAPAYEDFERRWTTAQITEGLDRAPIRFVDVLDDRPLLPFGPRRSLLPVLPGLFLGLGVFAALYGLIPSLSMPANELSPGAQSAWMTAQIGLALRATAWGFLCAIGTSVASRLIEGSFDARSRALDDILERAFGSVSPGELAELTRQTQQSSLDTLGRELSGFANELSERMDRGLQRIEQSTARAASLVSQEQRGALHTVVQELSLSVRQGVEHHLGELRSALQRAVEHQTSVTNGLAETFERMVENAQQQDRVAHTLSDSARAVEEAARSMSTSAGDMKPVLEHLGSTSRALADTSARINETQSVVARTAEGVRSSLEHAASGVDDQRQFIELSLSEIRRTLVGLGDGLGDSLQRSLREVDNVLGSTVGQLRDTLAESNETIERLAGPIRAAEGSTRETHVALDRMRSEVEALQQWMNQAIKPLRNGIADVDGRAEEIARAISEFTNHTRQIDKTMESLRQEIHEESRRLQGAGSDLGRQLKLTTDAVGFLESSAAASSDASRRTRPEQPAVPRERSWAPAPSDRSPASGADPETLSRPSGRAKTSDAPAIAALRNTDSTQKQEAGHEPAGRASDHAPKADDPTSPVPSDESPGRELLGLSGYRVGAPRAQGPDPYERFEGSSQPPSNIRHFPTRERELGDDLKLSGLLSPRGPGAGRDAAAPGTDAADESGRNSTGKSGGNTSGQSGADESSDRPGATRPAPTASSGAPTAGAPGSSSDSSPEKSG